MSASGQRDALRRLTGSGGGFAPLEAAPTKGARPGTIATGRPSSASGSNSGSLAESDYNLREYWAPVTVESTDGIFTLEVEPIKRIALDNGGFFDFQEPPAP